MPKIVYPRRCLHFCIVIILMIYNSVEWKSIFNIHYYFKLVLAKISLVLSFLLSFDQKNSRMSIALELLNHINVVLDLLKEVIAGDESRVYGYDTRVV